MKGRFSFLLGSSKEDLMSRVRFWFNEPGAYLVVTNQGDKIFLEAINTKLALDKAYCRHLTPDIVRREAVEDCVHRYIDIQLAGGNNNSEQLLDMLLYGKLLEVKGLQIGDLVHSYTPFLVSSLIIDMIYDRDTSWCDAEIEFQGHLMTYMTATPVVSIHLPQE